MQDLILIAQIIVSLLLIGAILIQNKGVGLGRVWGAGGGSSFTRRGLEKLVFRMTFILVAAFVTLSLIQLFI